MESGIKISQKVEIIINIAGLRKYSRPVLAQLETGMTECAEGAPHIIE